MACDAVRSVAWRVNAALALSVSAWPDSTFLNRTIKLLGAVGMSWGMWSLTRESVPLSQPLRVTTRRLAVACLALSASRVLLAAIGINEVASEPASLLVDALAMMGCGACCARSLRSIGHPGWARSAWACAVVYLLAAVLRALVLARVIHDAWAANWLYCLTMLALVPWAWAIASRVSDQPQKPGSRTSGT